MGKSIEYKLLGRIDFQCNKYNVYIDSKYRKFYLRIIDCDKLMNLTYPTLEEFINLNKLFGMNYINDIIYFSEKNDLGHKLSDSQKVRFIPKVLTKTGLVSLSVAILLSGCGMQDIETYHISETTSIVGTTNTEQTQTEETVKTKTVAEMTDEEVLEYYGYPADKIEDGTYSLNRIKSNSESYTVCRNVNEFKEYTGMEGIPTYEDLLDAIKNNESITGRYEEWFKEAIDNLSQNEEFNGVDFSVLLYNVQRMEIEEKTSEEIRNESEKTFAKAYFNPRTKKVAVNPDTVTQIVFLHEVLGHASTQTITEENIFFESEAVITVIDREDNGNINDINNIIIGYGLEEGKADLLAELALNNSMRSSSNYDIEKESFREFKETLGLTWADIINNSMTLKIIAKMAELGMDDSIKYVDNSDTLYRANMFDDVDDSIRFKNNIGEFLLDYSQSQIKTGRSIEDVSNQISQMIQESSAYPNYIGIATIIPIDMTNMKEFEEYVISLMEKSQNIEKEIEQDDNELEN